MAAADVEQILNEDGEVVDAKRDPGLTDAELRTLYRSMLQVRLLDERCMRLQRQGRIAFYGAATGEEAATIGSAFAFRDTDWVFPALRQGGALLMRGFPLTDYFHHLFGTSESVEQGRSMPCHYSDRRYNVVSWSSCMSTQLPHAVGAAYGAKLQGDDTVMAGYLGDGATSEGDFHSAMNFAGVWSVPVVFLLHNNHYAISVPAEQQTASEGFAVKAKAYGFPGKRVDGNDVLAVVRETRDAVDRARAGEGPTLLELVTYRMESHSTSDDWTRYRSEEEVEAWAERDPIQRFRTYLAGRDLWSEGWEEELREEITSAISEAIDEAETGGDPPLGSMVEDVYAETPWHLREQGAEAREYTDE